MYRIQPGKMMNELIAGNENQPADKDANQAGKQPDDKGFRIEHPGDISFGGADGPQNADFFGAFQHADIGDDADHDAGHNERYSHKGDQHIGDDIYNGRHRRHQ